MSCSGGTSGDRAAPTLDELFLGLFLPGVLKFQTQFWVTGKEQDVFHLLTGFCSISFLS